MQDGDSPAAAATAGGLHVRVSDAAQIQVDEAGTRVDAASRRHRQHPQRSAAAAKWRHAAAGLGKVWGALVSWACGRVRVQHLAGVASERQLPRRPRLELQRLASRGCARETC